MSDTSQPVVPQGYELKKKKPIYKRVWFWLLAIIVLIIVITVASGGGDEPTVSGGASNGGDSTGGDSAAPAGPTFQGQQEGDITAEPGQTITVDDVAITSTPLAEGDATFGPTLCTTVTIVNNSDESVSFNPFDYKLQDPAGASRDTTLGGSDTLLNSGELAPAGTVTGDVCFDNPTAATGQYAVIYEPAFSFSGDRAVWVNNR
jgi:hypothetical protein